MKQYYKVLTIAGSDSGGGAGIQADIKTISANGCFATSAITAITAQNTLGVSDIFPIPTQTLRNQISAVLEDIGADCVKIGMLYNAESIETVNELLQYYKITNIVLDPVMVATSGNKLLRDEALDSLKNILIPNVRVITPNIPEAEILLHKKINTPKDLPSMAKELAETFGVSVLLKAGHLSNNTLIDLLYNAETDDTTFLESERVHTQNTHGTGCTLSSALAAFIAKGYGLNKAAQKAKNYINNAITEGAQYKIGEGHGPVKHFYQYWKH